MRRRRRPTGQIIILWFMFFFLVKTNDFFLFCLFRVIQNRVWRMPMSSLILRLAMITSRKIRPYCMKNQKLWRSSPPIALCCGAAAGHNIFVVVCVPSHSVLWWFCGDTRKKVLKNAATHWLNLWRYGNNVHKGVLYTLSDNRRVFRLVAFFYNLFL